MTEPLRIEHQLNGLSPKKCEGRTSRSSPSRRRFTRWSGVMILGLLGLSACYPTLPTYNIGNVSSQYGRKGPTPLVASSSAEMLLDECTLVLSTTPSSPSQMECHRILWIRTPEALSEGEIVLPIPRGWELRKVVAKTLELGSGSTSYKAQTLDFAMVKNLTPSPKAPPSAVPREVGLDKANGATVTASSLVFRNVRPGTLLFYTYVLSYERLMLNYQHSLMTAYPVHRATFTLKGPVHALEHYERRFRLEEARGGWYQKWTLENYIPPSSEPYPPLSSLRAPMLAYLVQQFETPTGVQISVFNGWPDLFQGLWTAFEEATRANPNSFRGLELEYRYDDETLSQKADPIMASAWEVTQQQMDDRGAARLSGDGLPIASGLSWRRFGTADERAVVLLGLLRHAGIQASLVVAPNLGQPDLELPIPAALSRGDYLVEVRLGDSTPLYLDPLCEGCAPGELHWTHLGRTGYVFEHSSDWKRLLDVRPVELGQGAGPLTSRSTTMRLTLTPRGLMVKEGLVRLEGRYAASMRHALFQADAVGSAAEAAIRKEYLDGLEEGEVKFSGLEACGKPLDIRVQGSLYASAGYTDFGGILLLPLHALLPGELVESLPERRALPLEVNEAVIRHNHVILEMPVGYEVVQVPSGQALTGPCEYALEFRLDENQLEVDERFTLPAQKVGGDDYLRLRACTEQVRSSRQQVIRLRKA